MGFQVTSYRIHTAKLNGDMKIALLSDLHCREHGCENADLIRAVAETEPDLILCPGDLITANDHEHFRVAVSLFQELCRMAPVFLSNGNHETALAAADADAYEEWIGDLTSAGVHVVNNASIDLSLPQGRIRISGLELDFHYYRKMRPHRLTKATVDELLPNAKCENYHILLAHNPAFAKTYAQLGFDLIVSGHYHGGAVRSRRGRALFSPYGGILPRYGVGYHLLNGAELVVSAGLGDHAIPFRVNDPMELVVIQINGRSNHGTSGGTSGL